MSFWCKTSLRVNIYFTLYESHSSQNYSSYQEVITKKNRRKIFFLENYGQRWSKHSWVLSFWYKSTLLRMEQKQAHNNNGHVDTLSWSNDETKCCIKKVLTWWKQSSVIVVGSAEISRLKDEWCEIEWAFFTLHTAKPCRMYVLNETNKLFLIHCTVNVAEKKQRKKCFQRKKR